MSKRVSREQPGRRAATQGTRNRRAAQATLNRAFDDDFEDPELTPVDDAASELAGRTTGDGTDDSSSSGTGGGGTGSTARPQALRDRRANQSILDETLDPDSSDSFDSDSTPVVVAGRTTGGGTEESSTSGTGGGVTGSTAPAAPVTPTTTRASALVDDPAPARASTSALGGTPPARLFRTPSPAGERSDDADVKPLAFGEGYGSGLGKKGKSPAKTSGKKRRVVRRTTTTTTTTVVEEEVDDEDREEEEEKEGQGNMPPLGGKGGSGGGGRDGGGAGRRGGGGAGAAAAAIGSRDA
ncbi:hypothetical protein Rhopal_006053-T1 [Rhodotorula paludigena]|uniref:Uncharacterized protein n=1 Tax=Rhodotorula paludigena TaxID=86838 RepID=A0AAV5GWU2_9BASI|nr:hypothetical protein Rhopal_006041-T1 [Rhodotorula paludigena]GJN93008.1 hypothetical protein Rhopal_006053-T1 [Rhodotorula paludigena]